MKSDDALPRRLERLAGFADVFEEPGFVAGKHVTPASEPGVLAMRYARYHLAVERFIAFDIDLGPARNTPTLHADLRRVEVGVGAECRFDVADGRVYLTRPGRGRWGAGW